MSTHNEQFRYKIRETPENIPKYLFSWAIGGISKGLENEFEPALVHVNNPLSHW